MVISGFTHFPIKFIFLIHLILISWSLQSSWAPNSCVLYNVIFFLSLFWAIHAKDSPEPLQIAILINACSVAFDLIMLLTSFPADGANRKFSAAMAILNIVVRPFSCIVLYKVMKERGGDLGDIGNYGGAGGLLGGMRNYEDIDNPGSSNDLINGPLDFTAPPSPPVHGALPYKH